ncbi:MAG TPA: hypothetical protein VKA91_11600 [Nitrososphaeraceae archaeon]|nr:hypothetical protein [Nitrososphaeraceae archaeon]
MNESSPPPSAAAVQSTTSPLTSLQEILHNRIIQKKGEIYEPIIGLIMKEYGQR